MVASGNRKHRARQARAGLCLATLLLAPAGALSAAESGKAPFIDSGTGQQLDRVDAEGTVPDFASPGGALYNPFSPAFETAAATISSATVQASQQSTDGTLGLVTTTVAAFIAAGCLGLIVRFLVAG
ncbi:hypothetical protein [Variovorax sp. DT-64]|uniref:hypothetical protein n=1 Tax=Variovorax sp. DT-64 TaxID=3396160 RepID=UPI003F1B42D3